MFDSNKRGLLAALVAFALAAPMAANATSMVKLTTEDMAHLADVIVVGEVRSVAFENRGTVTRNEVRVIETWKGDVAAGKVIDVYEPGGRSESGYAEVAGTGGYLRGERVVVFLQARATGGYLPIGLHQGKYTVLEQGGKQSVTRVLVPTLERGADFDMKKIPAAMQRLDAKNDLATFKTNVVRIVDEDRREGRVGKDLPQYKGIGR